MRRLKRLIVAGIILAVIVVMALRGCPRVRRSAGMAHDSQRQAYGIGGTTWA